ncbi:hypothetical protein BKA70DRAFT_257026 [Coprinopsis sp. MPI-PUGE-AT-0042]|nr:hypothetical protein BKA70DRAFT_257026 [Coprinopsis sp. MPI-PUGE-AT-0042]
MRCFLLSWFNILVSISLLSRLVHGLQITIEEGDAGITINNPTTIRWNQEPTDPPDFDFRFVVGQFNDVGLAAANIKVDQPEQIRVLKRNSGGLDMVMEDLSKQVKWLEEHSESEWALGLTDVPPTGFCALYDSLILL